MPVPTWKITPKSGRGMQAVPAYIQQVPGVGK